MSHGGEDVPGFNGGEETPGFIPLRVAASPIFSPPASMRNNDV